MNLLDEPRAHCGQEGPTKSATAPAGTRFGGSGDTRQPRALAGSPGALQDAARGERQNPTEPPLVYRRYLHAASAAALPKSYSCRIDCLELCEAS